MASSLLFSTCKEEACAVSRNDLLMDTMRADVGEFALLFLST